MPLSNQQYEAILRTYEEKQVKSRWILESRLEEILRSIPKYQDLLQQTVTVSMEQGKKLLAGDDTALNMLHEKLQDLSKQKQAILKSAGYPADYLTPQYQCDTCKDTGYVGHEKCKCFKEQITQLLYDQSNIRQQLEKENFQTLSTELFEGESLKLFQNSLNTAQKFVGSFESDYQNLFFYGTVGTGKSFLSNCIAKELIELGHFVLYFSSAGLFDILSQNAFNNSDKKDTYQIYQDLYQCDLLIIDDLGTELYSSFVASQLFTCLNERHLRKKSLIISTNLSLQQLQDKYSDRIFSRITSNFILCKLAGPDIRMYKKRMLSRK